MVCRESRKEMPAFEFGNLISGTFGWFETEGTVDPLLYTVVEMPPQTEGNCGGGED